MMKEFISFLKFLYFVNMFNVCIRFVSNDQLIDLQDERVNSRGPKNVELLNNNENIARAHENIYSNLDKDIKALRGSRVPNFGYAANHIDPSVTLPRKVKVAHISIKKKVVKTSYKLVDDPYNIRHRSKDSRPVASKRSGHRSMIVNYKVISKENKQKIKLKIRKNNKIHDEAFQLGNNIEHFSSPVLKVEVPKAHIDVIELEKSRSLIVAEPLGDSKTKIITLIVPLETNVIRALYETVEKKRRQLQVQLHGIIDPMIFTVSIITDNTLVELANFQISDGNVINAKENVTLFNAYEKGNFKIENKFIWFGSKQFLFEGEGKTYLLTAREKECINKNEVIDHNVPLVENGAEVWVKDSRHQIQIKNEGVAQVLVALRTSESGRYHEVLLVYIPAAVKIKSITFEDVPWLVPEKDRSHPSVLLRVKGKGKVDPLLIVCNRQIGEKSRRETLFQIVNGKIYKNERPTERDVHETENLHFRHYSFLMNLVKAPNGEFLLGIRQILLNHTVFWSELRSVKTASDQSVKLDSLRLQASKAGLTSKPQGDILSETEMKYIESNSRNLGEKTQELPTVQPVEAVSAPKIDYSGLDEAASYKDEPKPKNSMESSNHINKSAPKNNKSGRQIKLKNSPKNTITVVNKIDSPHGHSDMKEYPATQASNNIDGLDKGKNNYNDKIIPSSNADSENNEDQGQRHNEGGNNKKHPLTRNNENDAELENKHNNSNKKNQEWNKKNEKGKSIGRFGMENLGFDGIVLENSGQDKISLNNEINQGERDNSREQSQSKANSGIDNKNRQTTSVNNLPSDDADQESTSPITPLERDFNYKESEDKYMDKDTNTEDKPSVDGISVINKPSNFVNLNNRLNIDSSQERQLATTPVPSGTAEIISDDFSGRGFDELSDSEPRLRQAVIKVEDPMTKLKLREKGDVKIVEAVTLSLDNRSSQTLLLYLPSEVSFTRVYFGKKNRKISMLRWMRLNGTGIPIPLLISCIRERDGEQVQHQTLFQIEEPPTFNIFTKMYGHFHLKIKLLNKSFNIVVGEVINVNQFWSNLEIINYWTKCSKTCGTGIQHMKIRTHFQSRQCFGPPCQVENFPSTHSAAGGKEQKWSAWNLWNLCSTTCGPGLRSRSRKCQLKNLCSDVGIEKEVSRCQERECMPRFSGQTRMESGWSDWTQWSPCPVTCGSGMSQRIRICMSMSRKYCHGIDSKARLCQSNVTCSKHPLMQTSHMMSSDVFTSEWGSWSLWTTCNVPCGKGLEERRRICGNGMKKENCLGGATENKPCIKQVCNVENKGKPVTIVLGMDTKLRCIFDITKPIKRIFWVSPQGNNITYLNAGDRFSLHGRVLYIKHLQQEDSGIYQCIVHHSAYDIEKANFPVRVLDCADKPCKHGGTCEVMIKPDSSGGQLRCLCSPNYHGSYCDFSVKKPNETNNEKFYTVFVLLVVGLFALILGTILCCILLQICWPTPPKSKERPTIENKLVSNKKTKNYFIGGKTKSDGFDDKKNGNLQGNSLEPGRYRKPILSNEKPTDVLDSKVNPSSNMAQKSKQSEIVPGTDKLRLVKSSNNQIINSSAGDVGNPSQKSKSDNISKDEKTMQIDDNLKLQHLSINQQQGENEVSSKNFSDKDKNNRTDEVSWAQVAGDVTRNNKGITNDQSYNVTPSQMKILGKPPEKYQIIMESPKKVDNIPTSPGVYHFKTEPAVEIDDTTLTQPMY